MISPFLDMNTTMPPPKKLRQNSPEEAAVGSETCGALRGSNNDDPVSSLSLSEKRSYDFACKMQAGEGDKPMQRKMQAGERDKPMQPAVRLCPSPKYREDMTDRDRADDPAILIVLADEATLGNIMALPGSPIPPPPQGSLPPLPNTAVVRAWIDSEVARHSRSLLRDL